MKKVFILFLILCFMLLILSCRRKSNPENSKLVTTSVEASPDNSRYPGVMYKGNYIWCGTMNISWGDLITNYTHEPVMLGTSDHNVLAFLDDLNNPLLTMNDMDSGSYYIKNGVSQSTIGLINKEIKGKFPYITNDTLNVNLGNRDVISYSYFDKNPKLLHQFKRTTMSFNDEKVYAFTNIGAFVSDTYTIYYMDSEHFVIGILLKDKAERLYFAKGYPMDKPDSVLAIIKTYAKATDNIISYHGHRLRYIDIIQIPIMNLDCRLRYSLFDGMSIENKEMDEYKINQVLEYVKFHIDESEESSKYDFIGSEQEIGNHRPLPMKFILDKPYWIILKRYDSDKPYFILGVKNTAFMQAAH